MNRKWVIVTMCWCRLQAAAAAKLDEVRRQTAARLQSTLRRHKTTDISICLQPACIIVPDRGIYTPYECIVLLLLCNVVMCGGFVLNLIFVLRFSFFFYCSYPLFISCSDFYSLIKGRLSESWILCYYHIQKQQWLSG